MPLVTRRDAVLDLYQEAAGRGWVIPAFGVENLTTVEAVLAATRDYGVRIGQPALPITLAITNLYPHRSQSVHYTHSGRWDVGLRLLLAALAVLTAPDSPYGQLSVMVHLDHIQPDLDAELLSWDLGQFSSIMFDASTLPFSQNTATTRRFVEQHRDLIVIEGACDEIVDAGSTAGSTLTTPERAEAYADGTGVDFIVANLGTEHRASAAELTYNAGLAREISARIGPRLVLHGCSSVPPEQVRHLYSDGICKVNIWTALERESSPALLAAMARHPGRVAGREAAAELAEAGILGPQADQTGPAHLDYFTTTARQAIVFREMHRVVTEYLELWYR